MGRDEVDHGRVMRTDHVFKPVQVKASVGGHSDHPGPGPVQGVQHAGEGRVLHRNRLTGQYLTADEQVHRLLATSGDDHLRRVGRQPEAVRQVTGHGGAQPGQPVREVAGGPGHRPELRPVKDRGRISQRRGHLRRAVHRGQAEIHVHYGGFEQAGEKAVRPVHGSRGRAVRDDAGTGALAAFRHALVAQHLVRGRHSVPADGQGAGQVAFCGQPKPGWQLAGIGQPHDPGRQQAVQRAISRGPVAEQVCQGRRADAGTRHHGPNWLRHDGANHDTVGGW